VLQINPITLLVATSELSDMVLHGVRCFLASST